MVLPAATVALSAVGAEGSECRPSEEPQEEKSSTSETQTTSQAEETGKDEGKGPVLRGEDLSDVSQTQQ